MTDDNPSGGQWPQRVVMMVFSTLVVLGLAELTVYAPAAIRKILLFSIAFGVVTGFIVSWSAKIARTPRVLAVTQAGLLILLGLSLMAVRSHHRLREELERANRKSPQPTFDAMLAEQLAADDPELAMSLERRRRLERPSSRDYLAIRLQPLGEWTTPWPAVFWGVEILLAMLAGVYVVHRRLRSISVTPATEQ